MEKQGKESTPHTAIIDAGLGKMPIIIDNVLNYQIINYSTTIVRLMLADKTIDFNMDKIFSIEYEESTKK